MAGLQGTTIVVGEASESDEDTTASAPSAAPHTVSSSRSRSSSGAVKMQNTGAEKQWRNNG